MPGREYVPDMPNTVTIGGGGGGSQTAAALRPMLREQQTVIVAMFDSGGSTGDIREEYGGPGWGDLNKNCVALSRLPEDALLGLEKKMGEGKGKSSLNVYQHRLGSLLLANYHQQFNGDIERIIDAYSSLYQIEGRVLPVTGESRELRLTTPWGETIYGEHEIDDTDIPDLKGSRLWFDQETKIGDQAAKAIDEADLAIIAPGDWTTSVGPVVATKGVVERLARVPAVMAVINIMNKSTQTREWTALDYLDQYKQLSGGINIIDRVIVNVAPLDPEALAKQEADGSTQVKVNIEELRDAGYDVVEAHLIDPKPPEKDEHDKLTNRAEIVHDKKALGREIMKQWFSNEFPDKGDRR